MTNRTFLKLALPGIFVLSSALPASAHVGHGEVQSFVHGFMHPIGGTDHLMAMVAVGLLAAVIGNRALWALPAAFMTMMAGGAVIGFAGTSLSFVEHGIALSVLVLGSVIALRLPLSISAAVAITGFFAVFHGYAHGAELPVNSSTAGYAAGFLTATGILHVVGISVGNILRQRDFASRMAGSAIALTGLLLAV